MSSRTQPSSSSSPTTTFALLSSNNGKPQAKKHESKKKRRFFRGFPRRRSNKVDNVNDADTGCGQECDATTLSDELNNLDVSVEILHGSETQDEVLGDRQVMVTSYHMFLDYLLHFFGLGCETRSCSLESTPKTKTVDTSQLKDLVHQDFTHLVVDNPSPTQQEMDNVTAVLKVQLDAAEILLKDFWKFYTLVHDHHKNVNATVDEHALCVIASSRRYQVVEICSPKMLREVFLVIQEYIRPRLLAFAQTPANVATILAWWEEQLYSNCFSQDGDSEMWSNAAHSWRQEDMEYLERRYIDLAIRKHLRSLLDRSILTNQGNDYIRQNQEGHLVTGLPESIIVMIRSQISVAQKHLPPLYLDKILHECNKELSRTVSNLMLNIESQWKDIGSSRFCAYINDAQRLADLMEEYYEDLEVVDEAVLEGNNSLLRELTQLALHGARFLSHRIVWDLRRPRRRFSRTTSPPLLSSVGSNEWEANDGDFSGTAVATTVATLNDYFKDVRNWLSSDFYFPKILKICVDLTLKAYLESFFTNTISSTGCNAAVVSRSIQDDYLRFVVFFNGETFASYFGRCGFYTQEELNYHAHILKSMGHILDPSNDPDDLVLDVKEVMREFTGSGTLVTLHLAGMRKKRTTQEESEEWLQVIARAEKSMQLPNDRRHVSDISTTSRSLYDLPDLRNSKQLRKLKFANIKRLELNVSLRSLQIVCDTNKLLSAPRSVNRYLEAVSHQIVRKFDRGSQQIST